MEERLQKLESSLSMRIEELVTKFQLATHKLESVASLLTIEDTRNKFEDVNHYEGHTSMQQFQVEAPSSNIDAMIEFSHGCNLFTGEVP